MKKKSCLTLALILVMMQIVSVFAVLPTAAENASVEKSYNVYQVNFENYSNTAISVEPEWAYIPASENFEFVAGENDSKVTATFKAAWSPIDGDNENITLYFLLEVKDSTNPTGFASHNDGFMFSIIQEDLHVWRGYQHVNTANVQNDALTWNYVYNDVNLMTNGTGATVKGDLSAAHLTKDGNYSAEFSFNVSKNSTLMFDIIVQDNYEGNNYCRYSWNGMRQVGTEDAPKGVLNIVDNPISVTTTAGASIRVDTTNEEHSGIRFATTVDVARLNALVAAGATVTTGTLIIPTATLGNTDFTIEGLTAAGLEAGKDYYNVVNQGNEWVTDNPGTWYGTLYNVKNFERQFSGVGYVTVTLNGSSYTVYGGYTAANARSIKDVAQAAIDAEIYKDNVTAMGILQGFTGGSVTQ